MLPLYLWRANRKTQTPTITILILTTQPNMALVLFSYQKAHSATHTQSLKAKLWHSQKAIYNIKPLQPLGVSPKNNILSLEKITKKYRLHTMVGSTYSVGEHLVTTKNTHIFGMPPTHSLAMA